MEEGEENGECVELGSGWTVWLVDGEADPGALRFEPEVAWPGRPVQLTEQTSYRVQVDGAVERRRFDLRLNSQSGFFRSFSRRDATSFSGLLNGGNFVGWSSLEVRVDGAVIGSLPVEVRSTKLDYRTDFRVMLDDLTAQLAVLIFDAFHPTAVPTIGSQPGPRTAALDALWLRALLAPDRLPAAFARIVREPLRGTRREYRWQALSQVARIGPQTVLDLVAHPEHLIPLQQRSWVIPGLPEALGDRAPRELRSEWLEGSLNTAENRLVKHTLERLATLTTGLVGRFRQEHRSEGRGGRGEAGAGGGRELLTEAQKWVAALTTMQQASFLAEVEAEEVLLTVVSPRVWQVDGYREFAQAWQTLNLTGRVVWDEMRHFLLADLRDMATLYEWWCLFQLLEAWRTVAGPVERLEFIEREEQGWRVHLRPGPVARAGPATFFYQRTYPRGKGSYSLDLRPDFALELGDRTILFDAKYRAETAEEFGSVPVEERTFERDDLYKMHTYRDAIRDATAAFVLYPGDEKRLLPAGVGEGPFTGVGVLPLRPGFTEPLRECLGMLLRRRGTEGPSLPGGEETG